MRRDVVTQVIVEYPDRYENFATKLEAERFINANLDIEEPMAAWLEDMSGKKKYEYKIVQKDGEVELED